MTVGIVAAFVLYLNNLFEPIQQLSQLYNTVQSAGAALSKIFGVLDTKPTVAERPGAVDLPVGGAIDVEDVTFAYGVEPGAHDVTLHVDAGERIALVGPTGAGKSTLAKLIARFYDPTSRARCASTASTCATRRCARCGNASSSCRRKGSCSRARCATTCASAGPKPPMPRSRTRSPRSACSNGSTAFPDGLETEVRERGSRLSAGERQLVSLARAALADPTILVLDEATSNLDPGTEHQVEQALERLDARAHRASSSLTACRRRSAPIASRSSTTAASPSSARTPSSSH